LHRQQGWQTDDVVVPYIVEDEGARRPGLVFGQLRGGQWETCAPEDSVYGEESSSGGGRGKQWRDGEAQGRRTLGGRRQGGVRPRWRGGKCEVWETWREGTRFICWGEDSERIRTGTLGARHA